MEDNRHTRFYLAMAAIQKAMAEAFRIDPLYDGDEATRQQHIFTYEKLAQSYLKMAEES